MRICCCRVSRLRSALGILKLFFRALISCFSASWRASSCLSSSCEFEAAPMRRDSR